MIPPALRKGASWSERELFGALEGMENSDDWIVFHSLSLGQNFAKLEGEADFIVLAPGHGIVIIEVKDAKAVTYKEGQWYLEKNPNPNKDPIRQLSAARRTLRGFLKANNQLGSEPIATMVWFAKLQRHDLDNQSPGDMQFFEWQLGWSMDLPKARHALTSVLEKHTTHFSSVPDVKLNPAGLTPERSKALTSILLSDFEGYTNPQSETKRRKAQERELLDEQLLVLDMVETNRHLYFDGPPGSGKTHLLIESARKLALSGKSVLITCHNLLLAEELDTWVGALDNVDVLAWNLLLLQIAGRESNPEDAETDWFEGQLPQAALGARNEHDHRGRYDAILVDEFQDIAANPLHVEVLGSLIGDTSDGREVVLCGDSRQQIMRPQGQWVDSLKVARQLLPHLVHVRLRRNCRMAPRLATDISSAFHSADRFINHRVPHTTEGGLEIVATVPELEVKALSKAVRELTKNYLPENIVILSMFGLRKSLARLILQPEESDGRVVESADQKWLRKQLSTDSLTKAGPADKGSGLICWYSIFKFKGLDAEAIILTDISVPAIDFAHSNGLDFDDTLFVGMTRAKYRCIALDTAQYFSH
jgi:hypothetical protein